MEIKTPSSNHTLQKLSLSHCVKRDTKSDRPGIATELFQVLSGPTSYSVSIFVLIIIKRRTVNTGVRLQDSSVLHKRKTKTA